MEPLLARIASRGYTVGIMGLGYVGLPLAVAAICVGFRVIGFDINEARVALINRGERGINHIPSAVIGSALTEGRFRATAKLKELGEPDAILIAVQTLLSKQREPDLRFVENSARTRRQSFSSRSTRRSRVDDVAWNHTRSDAAHPREFRAAGRFRFFLAFSPEREDPGNASFETATIPKIVGADDPTSLKLAVRYTAN